MLTTTPSGLIFKELNILSKNCFSDKINLQPTELKYSNTASYVNLLGIMPLYHWAF